MSQYEIEREQRHLNNTINKIENNTYIVAQLLHEKEEQFKKGWIVAGDSVAYRRGKVDQQILQNALKEPYFGKFEITSPENGHETFYIGKQGIYDINEDCISKPEPDKYVDIL